jgi:hypothetical protein
MKSPWLALLVIVVIALLWTTQAKPDQPEKAPSKSNAADKFIGSKAGQVRGDNARNGIDPNDGFMDLGFRVAMSPLRNAAEDAAPRQPANLAAIEKTIGKQPAYASQPRYCLLVFGAEANIRVWIVEDGRTLYIDRNANGDLTDDGPPLEPARYRELGSPSGSPRRWDYDYVLDEIKPVTGPAQTKFKLARWNYGEKEDSYGLSVTLHDEQRPHEKSSSEPTAGKTSISSSAGLAAADGPAADGGIPMYAGWFGTFWADSPAKASIIHFGGPLEPRFLREKDFVVDSGVRRLSVGFITPGLGDAGPARLSEYAIPIATPIHVRIDWPVAPGSPPLVTTYKLDKHCCYWEYYDPNFRVPQGKGIVEGTATVTIGLPDGKFPLPLRTNKIEARVWLTEQPNSPSTEK